MSGKKWAKRLQEAKRVYECQRELHSEQIKDHLSTSCRMGGKKLSTEVRTVVATLVVEAPFILTPDTALVSDNGYVA